MEQYRMIFKLLCFLIASLLSNCINFDSFLHPLQQRCFYQMLEPQQKYLIDFYPRTISNFTLTIGYLHKENKTWISQLSRELINQEYLNVHKLASSSSTYKICIYNRMNQKLEYEIELKWGLQLLQLKLLPDNSDTQTILTELQWLKKEAVFLFEKEKQANDRAQRLETVSSRVDNNLFSLSALFILVVATLNVWFYLRIKKMMNKRKMI